MTLVLILIIFFFRSKPLVRVSDGNLGIVPSGLKNWRLSGILFKDPEELVT